MYPSTGTLATGYTDLIGLETTVLVSVALFGHEHASSEIKVKTCIEMTLNESFYTNAHLVTNIPLVSGSFEESNLDCAINGRYSSSWIIHAASTVVSRPIKSVYPVANGPVDGYIGILNTTFRPRISKSSNELKKATDKALKMQFPSAETVMGIVLSQV
jgi:hypothetical protein